MSDGLTSTELKSLFVLICRVLAFDALCLRPRQRQFALLLSGESFALGSPSGRLGISAPVQRVPQTGKWCRLLQWRPSEIWSMLDNWRRAGWLALDRAEATFRLCPDNLPGWRDAVRLLEPETGQAVLPLQSGEDLHKTIAKFSQLAAADNAKISQLDVGGRGASVPEVLLTVNSLPFTVLPLCTEQLNGEQLTVNCTDNAKFSQLDLDRVPKSETNRVLESRPFNESFLMHRLTLFLGEEDLKNWGGDWRANWVRVIPFSISKALTILEQEENAHHWKAHTSKAAALKDLALRLPNEP